MKTHQLWLMNDRKIAIRNIKLKILKETISNILEIKNAQCFSLFNNFALVGLCYYQICLCQAFSVFVSLVVLRYRGLMIITMWKMESKITGTQQIIIQLLCASVDAAFTLCCLYICIENYLALLFCYHGIRREFKLQTFGSIPCNIFQGRLAHSL